MIILSFSPFIFASFAFLNSLDYFDYLKSLASLVLPSFLFLCQWVFNIWITCLITNKSSQSLFWIYQLVIICHILPFFVQINMLFTIIFLNLCHDKTFKWFFGNLFEFILTLSSILLSSLVDSPFTRLILSLSLISHFFITIIVFGISHILDKFIQIVKIVEKNLWNLIVWLLTKDICFIFTIVKHIFYVCPTVRLLSFHLLLCHILDFYRFWLSHTSMCFFTEYISP